MLSTFEREAEKFSNITTFHGFVRLLQARKWAKIFWATIILVSLVLFFVQAYNCFAQLQSKPISSVVETKVPQKGIDFPSVTICNYNPVKLSYIREVLNKTGDLEMSVMEYVLISYLSLPNLHQNYNQREIEQMHQKFQLFLQHHPDITIPKIFLDGRYKCSEMFLECSFGGQVFDCCGEFSMRVLTDMGVCRRFANVGTQTIAGSKHGLQFAINIKQYEYYSDDDLELSVNDYFTQGIRAVVQSSLALPVMSTGGISVANNYQASVAVIPSHFKMLEQGNWGQCRAGWEAWEATAADLPYSSSNCHAFCFAKTYQNLCECTPPMFLFDFPFNPCTPKAMYNCWMDHGAKIEKESFWNERCPNCDIECERWEFGLEVMEWKMQDNGIQNNRMLKRLNMTDDAFRQNNFLTLELYLKDVFYTEFEQKKATDPTTILSNIGGNMGLFLGMSVVTIAEILVFIGKVCWSSISKKRRRNLGDRGKSRETPEDPEDTTAAPEGLEFKQPNETQFGLFFVGKESEIGPKGNLQYSKSVR